MLEELEQNKCLSILSHAPVFFGEDECFWCGAYMTRQTCFALFGSFVFNIHPSKSVKVELFDKTLDVMQKYGDNSPFDPSCYGPDGMYSYLKNHISLKLHRTEFLTNLTDNSIMNIRKFIE